LAMSSTSFRRQICCVCSADTGTAVPASSAPIDVPCSSMKQSSRRSSSATWTVEVLLRSSQYISKDNHAQPLGKSYGPMPAPCCQGTAWIHVMSAALTSMLLHKQAPFEYFPFFFEDFCLCVSQLLMVLRLCNLTN